MRFAFIAKHCHIWPVTCCAKCWRCRGLASTLGSAARPAPASSLWLNDESYVRLRPEHPNHVWSCDFVESRTCDGGKFSEFNAFYEFTCECLSMRIARKLNSADVIDVLSDLFILRGVPGHIGFDNGPEFIATAVRTWIAAVSARCAFIEPGSPWEDGYCESFNSKLRDDLLNGEIFYSLARPAPSSPPELLTTKLSRNIHLSTSLGSALIASITGVSSCAAPCAPRVSYDERIEIEAGSVTIRLSCSTPAACVAEIASALGARRG